MAIKSFTEQRFKDLEICISDGCSTDGREQEIIEALEASGVPFVYQRSPINLRYDANLRTAIGLARGRYCILMGNDDALNDAEALAELWADMEKHAPVGVVISDFSDYRSGRRAFRIRESQLCGKGSRVAAFHFRNFSFVSGIVLKREPAQTLATDKWDGSEMYQSFVGCRMIASGEALLERAEPLVRKDIAIPGESVDDVRKLLSDPPITRTLLLSQLGRLTADAIAPYTSPSDRRRLNEVILLQLLGITYPYWLFEYRGLASWRYAVGIAYGMRPRHTAEGVELGPLRRLRVSTIYAVATFLGLTIPRGIFNALKSNLYRLAKSIR